MAGKRDERMRVGDELPTAYLETRKSGFVALFDVLGFSERIMRSGVNGLSGYIGSVLRLVRPRLGMILFSDTVVFYTFDDERESFDEIVQASSELLHTLIFAEVPIRGAIAHGEFIRSEHGAHGTFIAGRPIIEAHHYQQQMQWIGIMLTPSVAEKNPDLLQRSNLMTAAAPDGQMFGSALTALRVQKHSRIPLESIGELGDFEGYAIVPLPPEARTLQDLWNSFDQVSAKLQRLTELAPDPRSQGKYRRSKDWLSEVRSNFKRAFGNHIDRQ